MAHNDEALVVLEEVARVNKELINENHVLREDLERRDQEQRKILADLNQKLEEATSRNNRRVNSRRTSAKTSQVKVPAACRVSNFI
jgi:cellulose biosynthesis protein BcsQ